MIDDVLVRIKALIKSADGLLITAGAGMGVDSGLPDFRGNDGMWNYYPALGRLRKGFTSIANPQAFREHPELAWGFYGHRLQLYRQTRPHRGFAVLKALGERLAHGSFVFTSNVDGQFQQAGFDANRIYECHGSIHYLQCLQPCRPRVWSAHDLQPRVDKEACRLLSPPPTCPECRQLARPNILMFDDWHWLEQRYQLQAQRFRTWLSQVESPLVVEVGAGITVSTVRDFSDRFAARLIRINTTEAATPHNRGVSLAMTGLAGIELIGRAAGLDVDSL